jgi:hypothetical protein
MAAPTRALGLWLQLQGSPSPRFTAGCRPACCSLTGRKRTAQRKPDGYKLSTDPFFVEKVRDIVGLYLGDIPALQALIS